jgi:4-hydroxy-tetrahydrodipicolinate synthase
MNTAAISLKARLHGALIPAVPVPCFRDGAIDWAAQESYVKYMANQPVEGVAVWVHTGRGLHLSYEDRSRVMSSWREGLRDKLIIAGAGGAPDSLTDSDYVESASRMAEHAKELGADGLLCYAPVRFREFTPADRDDHIIAYHRRIADAGLPLILFYLYEAAGGISYSEEVLRALFALPSVCGIKMATLDSVTTFQNVASLLTRDFPEHLLITGEDRFLGYSIMCGAKAALIGMGAALPHFQKDLLSAYLRNDAGFFLKLSRLADLFAEFTFKTPMEGYISRMLYVLAEEGVIPYDSCFDPWGPILTEDDKQLITATLNTIHKSL